MVKLRSICLMFGSTFAPVVLLAAQNVPVGMTVVKFRANDAVLNNPGIGFTTFQRFNGDPLNAGTGWTEGFPIESSPIPQSLTRSDHPLSSIAYLRLYWRFAEPKQEEYRWDLIDKALETAHARGQTLMLRIAPYGTGEVSDVPAWYRAETGEVLAKDRPEAGYAGIAGKWIVNPENPAYAKEFGGFIRKLAERYDGNPDLELVDLSILAAWGEGAGTELLTDKTRRALVDSYMQGFRKTPLATQLSDAKTVAYTLSLASNGTGKALGPAVGWRADCLGDMGGFNPTWNHMNDLYPEAVVSLGLDDAWRKAPVALESCWVMQHWKDAGWDLQYIMDQAVKWHMSSFNGKSSAVPAEWWPQVNWWLNHMGYRFALRRFAFTPVIDASRKFAYESWWENKGNAPVYRPYTVALRFTQGQHQTVVPLEGDPRTWMPGDSLLNGTASLPPSLADGDYKVSIALVDPVTHAPRIKLAIDGVEPDGWYPMGMTVLHAHSQLRAAVK